MAVRSRLMSFFGLSPILRLRTHGGPLNEAFKRDRVGEVLVIKYDEPTVVPLLARLSISVFRTGRDRLNADVRCSVDALAEVWINGAIGRYVQCDVNKQGNFPLPRNHPPPHAIGGQSPLCLPLYSLLNLRLEVFYLPVDGVLRHVVDEPPSGDRQKARQSATYSSAHPHLRKPNLELWGRRFGGEC